MPPTARRRAGFALLVVVTGPTLYAQLAGKVTEPTLFRSGDTNAVLAGSDVAADCLRDAEVS